MRITKEEIVEWWNLHKKVVQYCDEVVEYAQIKKVVDYARLDLDFLALSGGGTTLCFCEQYEYIDINIDQLDNYKEHIDGIKEKLEREKLLTFEQERARLKEQRRQDYLKLKAEFDEE